MPTDSLTLRSISARAVRVPLVRPIVTRIACLDEWPLVLVDLHTEEGVIGRSYIEPYSSSTLNYIVPAIVDLGGLLKRSRVAPVDFFQRALRSLQFAGHEGISMIAASAVDMAAWDALARLAGVPLCVLLGGTVGRVRAYNSNGLWLNPPGHVADEAERLLNEGGFQALKLRLGRQKAEEDMLAIRCVREQVGEEVELMVDYNQGLDYAEALRRCVQIDDLGLAWIEEPLVYGDLEGHARLRGRLKTPLQIGENFYGPRQLHRALQMNACDLVMPDFMRIGGVTGWMRASAIAAAHGIPVSTHLYPEIAAQVMRVTETAHWLEWQDWANPVIRQPYRIENGFVRVPDRAGTGIEWDEAAVSHYAV